MVIEIRDAPLPGGLAAFDGSRTQPGFSALSFEEALDNAISAFEQDGASEQHPDQMVSYSVVTQGKLKGGFVGQNLFFVNVERNAEVGSGAGEAKVVDPSEGND